MKVPLNMVKLNLLLNNFGDSRSGYLNVSPFAPEGGDISRCALGGLEKLVDANEASELVAHGVFDTLRVEDANSVLDHWISRLAHGGELVLSVVDASEVCRDFSRGKLDLNQLNSLLYGDKECRRNCVLTLSHLSEVLENKGLKVLKKRFHNYRGTVVARRP